MELIGHKSVAIFDLWSIAHLLLGLALGQIPAKFLARQSLVLTTRNTTLKAVSRTHQFLFVFLFTLGWEVLEFTLEAGLAGPDIGFWFQGHEFILNRALSDPLLVLFGFWLANTHARWIVWPSRVALLAWGWFFIIVLPHSMAYSL